MFSGGSSPRLRGTSVASAMLKESARFIPAPAGNINCGRKARRHTAVHPRACGEHVIFVVFVLLNHGSSPRLRGTCGQRRPANAKHRFIPAPAGNISPLCWPACQTAVHPRACGEHSFMRSRSYNTSGSSPRLRGTLHQCQTGPVPRRFIPAPAGNMIRSASARITSPVHPRACGEHTQPGGM